MTVKEQVISKITECKTDSIEFEEILEQYLDNNPNDYDRFSILANYHLMRNNLEEALVYAKKAVKINQYVIESNYNLAEIYFILEDFNNALKYYLRTKAISEKRSMTVIDSAIIESMICKCKEQLSKRNIYIIERQIEYAVNDPFRQITSLAGEVYVNESGDMSYIGLYNNWSRVYCGGIEYPDNYQYEIINVEGSSNQKRIDIEGDYILPIVGRNNLSDDNNWVFVKEDKTGKESIFPIINQKSYSYLRLNGKVDISSDFPIVFGKPIELKHHNKKKLVINLFIDSFNYRIFSLAGNGDEISGFRNLMPNTFSFFIKGVICTNAYSDSEWTTPSLSSYWTGQYSHEHLNIDENIWWPFTDDIKLFPELFKEAGYVTSRIGENQESANPSQGHMRGIDRFVSIQGHNDAGSIISDTIEQIEAFKDADQFIVVSFEDLHKIAGGFDSSISIQANTPVSARVLDNEGTTTVKQGRSKNKQVFYEQELKRLDRYLGILFNYLKQNYNDEEYVVSMFSDHGTAFLVDDSEKMICEQRTHIPMMFYSDSINGICNDFVQNVDFAEIMCSLCGVEYNHKDRSSVLPEFFGGDKSREYVLSQTIYMGDPYQAMIKDSNGSYYYETESTVDNECRINEGNIKECFVNNNGDISDNACIKEYRRIIENSIGYLIRR